ncbi:MAG: hypothetical protein ABH828_05600 [archaeon]
MTFEQDKERTLKKMISNDQSNKGSVDKPIKKLLGVINKTKNFYTTSSCSGRIILIRIPKSGKKKEAEFLYRTHSKAKVGEVMVALNKKTTDSVWFRQEAAILHVAARTLDIASKFLRIARLIGFKRSGIFEVKRRVIMELIATEKMEVIVAKNGKVLVDEDYVKVLVDEGNKKMESSWDKLNRLKEKMKEF